MPEVYRSGRNLLTTHGPEEYPGLLVVKPGAGWDVWVIVPEDGSTIVARGGERVYGYETIDGGQAAGFELGAGDRATLARSGLPFSLVEWTVRKKREAGIAGAGTPFHILEAAMGCDPERVTGYVDGELSRAAALETRRHLSSCRFCAAQATFEIGLGDLLRSLPDPPTPHWAAREMSGARSAFSIQ